MPSTYHVRPGTLSDIHAATDLYAKSFGNESILDFIFPERRTDSEPFLRWLTHRFHMRWWTPGYVLTIAETYDDKGGLRSKPRPVGFTWWHRPQESLTFRERWLTIHAWVAPIMRAYLNVHEYLFPFGTTHPDRMGMYDRVIASEAPSFINTPRRQSAWYLSSLGVNPQEQGTGIGSMLLVDGLRDADHAGAATWLVGLRGLETYYSRFGFVEVARLNVGELKDWDGGSVMFRED